MVQGKGYGGFDVNTDAAIISPESPSLKAMARVIGRASISIEVNIKAKRYSFQALINANNLVVTKAEIIHVCLYSNKN
jgi:hypothetical protein